MMKTYFLTVLSGSDICGNGPVAGNCEHTNTRTSSEFIKLENFMSSLETGSFLGCAPFRKIGRESGSK
jgi:hypothetical protein